MHGGLAAGALVPWPTTGVPATIYAGTTQNDIIKEYLSRGTHGFRPKPSLKLTPIRFFSASTCRIGIP